MIATTHVKLQKTILQIYARRPKLKNDNKVNNYLNLFSRSRNFAAQQKKAKNIEQNTTCKVKKLHNNFTIRLKD